MPAKKAPVIVVRKSRLSLPVAESTEPTASPARSAPALPADTPPGKPSTPSPPKAGRRTPSPSLIRHQQRYKMKKVAMLVSVFPKLWPDFEKDRLRPMKVGIREQGQEYIEAHPDCGITVAQWSRGLWLVVQRVAYLKTLQEGATRYDIHGEPAGTVTASDAEYARDRISTIRARFAAAKKKENSEVS